MKNPSEMTRDSHINHAEAKIAELKAQLAAEQALVKSLRLRVEEYGYHITDSPYSPIPISPTTALSEYRAKVLEEVTKATAKCDAGIGRGSEWDAGYSNGYHCALTDVAFAIRALAAQKEER